mmetsp:Transcript_2044/g.3614  ORF Transcript_2044/g.3614 Transcript_2044/m.3614 type:complete len:137 (-) Transcript_2044:186-596(-)
MLGFDQSSEGLGEEGAAGEKGSRVLGGISKIMSWIVRERLDNEDAIKRISCPCFIVHGLKDALVPYTHAKRLHEICGTKQNKSSYLEKSKRGSHSTGGGSECSLLISQTMTHNEFDIDSDFMQPIENFLNTLRINY